MIHIHSKSDPSNPSVLFVSVRHTSRYGLLSY